MQSMSFLRHFLAATLLVLAMWLQPLVSAALAADMPDRLQHVALLRAQDFAELEKRLSAIQAAFEDGRIDDSIVDYAFNAFANSDDALDAPLTSWVERAPKSGAAHLARGVYLEHRGWLSRGTHSVADTPQARFDRMRDYFRLAGAEYDRALGANPHLTAAIVGLMRIAMSSGPRDGVKLLFEAGLAANPQSHKLHIQYLHSLRPEWGGSVRAVKAHVARLATARPEPAARYFQGYHDYVLGDQAHRNGDLKLALVHFDRALTFGTTSQFLSDRAYVRLRLGMGDAALEDMRRAVAMAPNIPEYLGRLADIEMFTNRSKEAIATLTKAIAVDALDPEFRKDRAFLLLRVLGQKEEAALDMEAAMAFGDLDPAILRSRARFYIETNKQPLAVESAKRALALAPKDSRNYYEYAQALYFNQDCKAHQVYAEFRRMCPFDNHCDVEKGMAMPGNLKYFNCDLLPRK